jgi:UDP:flavonoid glycosyltransferase YjiC (YdhE family)
MHQIVYATDRRHDAEFLDVFLSLELDFRSRNITTLLVTAATDQAHDAYMQVCEEKGISHLHGPHTRLGFSGHSHVGLLKDSFAFSTVQGLVHVLRFWLRLLQEQAPRCLVTDSCVPALLAARILGLPTVMIDTGFFQPDMDVDALIFKSVLMQDRPLEPLDQDQWQSDTHQVLGIANAALKQVGDLQLASWKDLFICDQTVRLSTLQMSALPSLEQDDFLGLLPAPKLTPPPAWVNSERTQPNIAVCLQPHVIMSHAVVKVLEQNPNWHVGLLMPIYANTPPQAAHAWRMSDASQFLSAIEHADLVICHPDHALLAQITRFGKPSLLVPVTTEHQLRTWRFFTDGRCLYLGVADKTEADVHAKILNLLESPIYTARSRQAQGRIKTTDASQVVSSILSHALKPQQGLSRCTLQSTSCTSLFKPRDWDTVFLSFDEPNADLHWEQLKQQVPTAKRVHGVVGFDASHKAAAAISETQRLTIIDADNMVDAAFFDIERSVPVHLQEAVWTWTSQNKINGLIYPFGGVKVWTQDIINAMRSHELADTGQGLKLDFWDQPGYYVFHPCHSSNITGGSPYQAFRGGYREGVKLTGWSGMVRTPQDLYKVRGTVQFKRLFAWMALGRDVENGLWSMLGARLGCIAALSSNLEAEHINDYLGFKNFWFDLYRSLVDEAVYEQTAMGMHLGPVQSTALNERLIASRLSLAALSKLLVFQEISPSQSAHIKAQMHAKRTPITDLFKPFSMYDGL